jgi:transposase
MIDRILALDLGKTKTAARLHCTDGRADFSTTVATSPQELHDLILATDPTLIIIETSMTAWWVHDLAVALEKKVIVTANNGPGWKWKNVRNKSDRGDAAKLIKMHLSDQLEPVHVPEHAVRQWRGLINQRHDLVGDRTGLRNRITGLLGVHGIPVPGGCTPWSRKWTEQLAAHTRLLAECEPTELWRGRLAQDLKMLGQVDGMVREVEDVLDHLASQSGGVALMREEPGVGPRLSETLAAVIDNPLRFRTGRQVACYVGLTPRHWSSGDTVRCGHISKQGNALLRTLLVEVSWLALRHNAWMRATFDHVKRGMPSRSKIAIVAVARRLLVRLWARWRDLERDRLAGINRGPTAPPSLAA